MPLTFRDHLKNDGWIPLHSFHGNRAIADLINDVEDHKKRRDADLIPSVQALKDLIEGDPDLYMLFTDMFKEAGQNTLVPDYKTMVDLINDVVRQPPIFRDYYGGAPGLSFNNILGAVILTRSGFNAFSDDRLNVVLQKILQVWFQYLDGTDSVVALTPQLWLSDESIFNLSTTLQGFDPENPTTDAFKDAYVTDLADPHWGFKSWNGFFARPFASDAKFTKYRPMPPDPSENDILSTADSKIYGIAANVSELDTFWLKGHRYSLKHLLQDIKDPDSPNELLYKRYIGGTVYQAYLLPSDFHRWTMPFKGTVQKVATVPGTYFALSNALVDPAQPDEFASLVEGLPFLTIVSARKVAIIKADNAKIGTVSFIPVGLQEISSIQFSHDENIPVELEKGAELGNFNYGGSTVVMVFEPGVNIDWSPVSQLQRVKIRSRIGKAY